LPYIWGFSNNLNQILFYIWLLFVSIFGRDVAAQVPVSCQNGQERNSAICSYGGYVLPGFPTRETWRRRGDTPAVFYGRAVHYDPGMMWSTALVRGFDREYLVQFDCLVSGFFINDVGRVAWVLYGGSEFRCLVVDNARPRDLFAAVILNREAVEVEFRFFDDVLDRGFESARFPVVLVAYQIDRPTPKEWMSAKRLDTYLLGDWETSRWEPKGWIQIRPDQQAWYKMDGSGEWWTRISGCLFCADDSRFQFVDKCDYYEVVAGDTLELIAKKVYGYSHPRFWDAIFEANRDRMENPYFIKPGLILRIPLYNEILD